MNDKEGVGYISLEEAMQVSTGLEADVYVYNLTWKSNAGEGSGRSSDRLRGVSRSHASRLVCIWAALLRAENLEVTCSNLHDTRLFVPQIMYLRYGRAQLDYQLEEVFGTSDLNSGKLLTLTEFLHCLHASQVKQLLNRCGSSRSNRDSVAAVLPGVPPRVNEKPYCSAGCCCSFVVGVRALAAKHVRRKLTPDWPHFAAHRVTAKTYKAPPPTTKKGVRS